MKVSNMLGRTGKAVANQFILTDTNIRCFQSYESIIIEIRTDEGQRIVALDRQTWDYSTTTAKYRNMFLHETTKETEKKIKSGEYILTDLN